MNKRIFLLVALAGLTCSISNASITNVVAWGDYNNIDCYLYTWSSTDNVLTMQSDQYAAGRIWGTIQTDTPTDPTLTLANTINNDTLFNWTSYLVDVYMNQSFSILSPTIIGPIYGVGNWGVQSYTPAATFNGTQWVGHLVLAGSTPIAPSGLLSFSYAIQFMGSANFTEVLTPVPEPNAFGLLLGGTLLFGSVTVLRPRRYSS